MNLLVIGGTRFVGRHIVDSAIARGHTVTLFNRGQSRTEPVEGVEEIAGDRETDLDLLAGRKWDAVIDTCGYVPRIVELSADALKDSVDKYCFISTISVYSDHEKTGQGEDGEKCTVEDPTTEEINGETYGGLKVLCEERIDAIYGDRALHIRPGLIVGPWDSTDRFTYWPTKFARNGTFLAPDLKDHPIQFIDGRDLADFTIKRIEDGGSGPSHVCAPYPGMKFGDFIERGVIAMGGTAEPVWLAPDKLEQQDIKPWVDLPFIISYDGSGHGLEQMDNSKAISEGLKMRSVEDTVQDTIEWWNENRNDEELKTGLTSERESTVLSEVKEKSAPS